jgi:hypothetical protein
MRRSRALTGLLLCCVAVSLVASLPASAKSRRPWLGLYECTGTNGLPLNAFKLMRHGRYAYGVSRMGQRLNNPVRGRWRMRGKTVVFRSGVYRKAGFVGIWNAPGDGNTYPHGFIAIKYRHGGLANIGCYPQPRR